ncbi:MAG TPA: hypothetical protein VGJ07_16585 [Rugosimonospora sp.]|jgi:hypothetical protein
MVIAIAAPSGTPEPAAPDEDPRWIAVALQIFVVLVLAGFGAMAWVYLQQASDGYRATHHGVPGTVVITHRSVTTGEGVDISVSGDFTPSAGGRTSRGVHVDTKEPMFVGDVVPVVAARPDPGRVYLPGSRGWIGSLVVGSVVGVVTAALTVLAGVSWVRGVWAGRRRAGP